MVVCRVSSGRVAIVPNFQVGKGSKRVCCVLIETNWGVSCRAHEVAIEYCSEKNRRLCVGIDGEGCFTSRDTQGRGLDGWMHLEPRGTKLLLSCNT